MRALSHPCFIAAMTPAQFGEFLGSRWMAHPGNAGAHCPMPCACTCLCVHAAVPSQADQGRSARALSTALLSLLSWKSPARRQKPQPKAWRCFFPAENLLICFLFFEESL